MDINPSPPYEVSYAFNGGVSNNTNHNVTIGGTVADYQAIVCADHSDCTKAFNNVGATLPGAIPTAANDLSFAEPLYYYGMDLMLKIQNYVPPMKEELDTQLLAINTWNRETELPAFFYDYFIDTFMI